MRIFRQQLLGELLKLLARGRTSLALAVLPPAQIALVALLCHPSASAWLAREFVAHLGPEHASISGPTAALLALSQTILPLGTIFLALVSGDIVSKEVEDGTMRMILTRPISRIRVLILKFAACAIYTLLLALVSGAVCLAAGMALLGPGELVAIAPLEHLASALPPGEGLARYLLALPFLATSLMLVTALGFMLSCFDMKPSSAACLTAGIFLADAALRQVPAFDPLKHVFLSASLSAWLELFQERVPWAYIGRHYSLILALGAVLFAIAWLRFRTRDFKS